MNTSLQDFYQQLSQDDSNPLLFNPHLIDDWLADELCQSGMMTTNSIKQPILLPDSPPIDPSPTTLSSGEYQALFPKIQPKKAVLPKIAPRPVIAAPVIQPLPTTPTKRTQPDKEQDDIILKRQKNTDAARRSRLKKMMKMEQLEQKVSELETDKQKLTTRVAVLESEKQGLESKSSSHEDRIKILETQLAEAHKALTNKS